MSKNVSINNADRKAFCILAFAGMLWISAPVSAQVYVGGDSEPTVEVDFNVLNSLPHTGSTPSAAPSLQTYSTPDHQLEKFDGSAPLSLAHPRVSQTPVYAGSSAPSGMITDTTADLNRVGATPVAFGQTPVTTAGTASIPAPVDLRAPPIPATSALEAGRTMPQPLSVPASAGVTAMPLPPANTTPTGIAAAPLPNTSAALPQAIPAAMTATGPLTADDLRLAFKGGDEALPGDQASKLDRVASKLKSNPDLRVELRSFAAAGSDTGSKARRLSLSRALMVRSALTQRGVDTDRIDVRALGAATDAGDADTVDIFLVR